MVGGFRRGQGGRPRRGNEGRLGRGGVDVHDVGLGRRGGLEGGDLGGLAGADDAAGDQDQAENAGHGGPHAGTAAALDVVGGTGTVGGPRGVRGGGGHEFRGGGAWRG